MPIRCPHCGLVGAFAPSAGGSFQHSVPWTGGRNVGIGLWYGVRHCPSPHCTGPVFVIEQNGDLVLSYPPQTIDFDASSVPGRIVESLREAIQCHAASCFRGAALLVRRTLEEVCQDRGAQGRDLKTRIGALAQIITIPLALIDAMDEIRLLGNDAAHVEAKTYDDIGPEEVEIAIELCKELVKSTYQYGDLVSKIRAFKKP